ncbi:hypothetical protein JL107_01495 [Nakamurella flavida]|uniref:Uncharacterized protein n=1 Tax=Nakamurella flavida TaxID=363630 RepID=A0A939C3Y8_9ACTN|nr:hypothetical protein [Nakamurella flavida]MBM9475109.1 hypothetical protein [Nakamurella flavida]MDP9776679.1 hypothetical protein [Nakamurella flavida]
MPSDTLTTQDRDTGRAVSRDLVWRAGLVLLAELLVVIGAPTWLTTPVVVVAALVVLERVARLRRRGRLDAVLVGLGGAVVVVALTGLLLTVLPWGLTRLTWSIALSLLALLALALAEGRPAAPSLAAGLRGQVSVLTLVCTLIAGGIVTEAIVMSVVSTDQVTVPGVQMAAPPAVDGATTVTITSGRAAGPLDIVVETSTGRSVLATGIVLDPDVPVQVPLTLTAGETVTVQLINPGQSTPVRELILDGTPR